MGCMCGLSLASISLLPGQHLSATWLASLCFLASISLLPG